ncbi:MAG: sigma-70 family RNA polymerase sigma factor [Isosphaeraceae bacterium]
MAEKQRLTEIPTEWTLVRTAHINAAEGGTPNPASTEAMEKLIGRYHDAIARYLRLKLRDENLADEVMQEFWAKLLTHKLAGADPSKGRFRDYLRTVLHRLIIDHFRGRKVQQLPPGDLLDPSGPDEEFDHVWRKVVIDRVISRLETYEVSTPKNRYATVLHLRLNHPDTPIEDLAQKLSTQVGTRVSPEAFRKTLQRARAKFVELLIIELRETIHPSEPEDIEAEIFDLGLGSFYRRYTEDNAL